MAYQKKGGAFIPPPPPPLPFSAAKGRKIPPPAPPTLTPEIVSVMTKTRAMRTALTLTNIKRGIVPGEPGIPVPIGGEDYHGRVNSTIDPAYDIYLQSYYADFSVRDENGFMKLFRMFGNSPGEVIQYIANFKDIAKLHGIVRAEEPVSLRSIIRQLETLNKQK